MKVRAKLEEGRTEIRWRLWLHAKVVLEGDTDGGDADGLTLVCVRCVPHLLLCCSPSNCCKVGVNVRFVSVAAVSIILPIYVLRLYVMPLKHVLQIGGLQQVKLDHREKKSQKSKYEPECTESGNNEQHLQSHSWLDGSSFESH